MVATSLAISGFWVPNKIAKIGGSKLNKIKRIAKCMFKMILPFHTRWQAPLCLKNARLNGWASVAFSSGKTKFFPTILSFTFIFLKKGKKTKDEKRHLTHDWFGLSILRLFFSFSKFSGEKKKSRKTHRGHDLKFFKFSKRKLHVDFV